MSYIKNKFISAFYYLIDKTGFHYDGNRKYNHCWGLGFYVTWFEYPSVADPANILGTMVTVRIGQNGFQFAKSN